MGTRTLVVLRHAEAVHGMGMADADRPLTEGGVRDARRAGEALTTGAGVPDLVLCSTASRTRQTWRELRTSLASPAGEPSVVHESRIYSADAETLLDLLRETDDEIGTLLLIGHNPTVHLLVWTLVGEADLNGFPPAAFAEIELPGAWVDLAEGTGELTRFWVP